MRTGLTNNRNVLTATTHRSTATPVYLQYPKYVAGVEHALHMAYKHLICKCKNSFAFTDFQFANLVAIFTNVCYNVTMYFDKGGLPNMRISYNKLWKMLIDKNMKKSDLKEKAGISSASLAKLGKGDNITTDVLLRICEAMDCRIEDILETVRD